MSESLLQSLLAIRQAVMQVKAKVGTAEQVRLDMVATLLARLIVDARDLPALQRALRDAYGAAGAAAQPADLPPARIAELEGGFVTAWEAAMQQELQRGAAAAAQATDGADEVFDTAAFCAFLVAAVGERAGVEVADVALASRGFSKKTLLVTLRGNAVLPAQLAVRVDRPFNFLGTTVLDEFTPLVALHRAGIRLPQPLALEPSGKVLDGPFIVFERRPGGLIGNNFQAPARNPAVAADVARCLAQLHRTAPERLPPLRGAGLDACAQTLQEIDKSEADWQALHRDLPLMDAAFRWLRHNVERADGACGVVHGDWNFNNILIDGDAVSAVVDWEFLHYGNPAADLGWFHFGATGICGWQEFLRLYREAGGFDLTKRQLDYFTLLGQTRLAVMTLQTDSGFNEGRFDDVKFGLSGALYTSKALARVANLLQAIASPST